MSLKAILFWLVVGSYLYQFFGDQNWGVAFERSYFQASAILGVWFARLMDKAPSVPSTDRESVDKNPQPSGPPTAS